jgi:maleylpyruvate isomerase
LSLLQSPAILDYLEEHYPDPRLLPEPAPARQRVRELSALVGCDIHPVNNLRVLKYLRREFEADDARIAEWYRHWIAEGFSAYEKLLGATDRTAGFCVGAATSMAEIYLLPQIYNARRFDLDMTPYPRIAEIEARCLDLSEFRNAHPDQSKP